MKYKSSDISWFAEESRGISSPGSPLPYLDLCWVILVSTLYFPAYPKYRLWIQAILIKQWRSFVASSDASEINFKVYAVGTWPSSFLFPLSVYLKMVNFN